MLQPLLKKDGLQNTYFGTQRSMIDWQDFYFGTQRSLIEWQDFFNMSQSNVPKCKPFNLIIGKKSKRLFTKPGFWPTTRDHFSAIKPKFNKNAWNKWPTKRHKTSRTTLLPSYTRDQMEWVILLSSMIKVNKLVDGDQTFWNVNCI